MNAPFDPSSPASVLDVDALLGTSEPQPGQGRFGWVAALIAIVLLLMVSLGHLPGDVKTSMQIFLVMALVCAMGFSSMGLRFVRKAIDRQETELTAVEELIRLRRWPEAVLAIRSFLSSPSVDYGVRARALSYLAAILSRFDRFDEALAVQDELLKDEQVIDPMNGFAVRVGRVIMMLRQDHLVDANGALSQLRKQDPQDQSGPLAMVEIYRDVKTGHPQEAIDIFNERQKFIRQQMGHRIGDAHALVARAYDMLNQPEQAQAAFTRATTLLPGEEIRRRYPETALLFDKYQSASAPGERPR